MRRLLCSATTALRVADGLACLSLLHGKTALVPIAHHMKSDLDWRDEWYDL
jgi:hypothetical protein